MAEHSRSRPTKRDSRSCGSPAPVIARMLTAGAAAAQGTGTR